MAREALDQVLRSLEDEEEPLSSAASADQRRRSGGVLDRGLTGRFPYDAGRVRAAQALLPHQRPKLAAMTVSNLNGQDFATLLNRAIARSQAPPRQIEHRRDETVPGVQWSGPLRQDGGNNNE